MYQLNINSETAPLKSVMIGIASDRGNKVHENNPKISKYLKQGTFPTEEVLIGQVDKFANTIESAGIEVLRPENITNQDQIFTRDIGFVIGEKFVLANMKKSNRKAEQDGLEGLLKNIEISKILTPPDDASVEGGDVIIHGKYVFVGLTGRTNYKGYEFLKSSFPEREVVPFHMYVTDNPATNILHLDCAFQPVGDKYAIIYEDGFVHYPDAIVDVFGNNNLIKVTQYEMYHMNPNIFSLSPELVITDETFDRLNPLLKDKNINTIEVNYREVSKLGGLFRCSTMPLIRT
ncbi:MAG: amidinotransferase [Candidatus Kapabacteria bacterium]|nr:amidinotransferase [Ignavibacteriota bacterium]MCW5884234.1 amidinotransferase [Candidatus Kapabacteria bacterium]